MFHDLTLLPKHLHCLPKNPKKLPCCLKCLPRIWAIDAPPSSLMDSTTSLKVKTSEGERVGARSLARNTSRVEGCAGAPRWD